MIFAIDPSGCVNGAVQFTNVPAEEEAAFRMAEEAGWVAALNDDNQLMLAKGRAALWLERSDWLARHWIGDHLEGDIVKAKGS